MQVTMRELLLISAVQLKGHQTQMCGGFITDKKRVLDKKQLI